MALYLDNAATSFPKPHIVYERLRAIAEQYGASPGRGGYALARQAKEVLWRTREQLARLFHADEPARIAFALNTTDALNMAIKGIMRPGDHVVMTALEHNSVIRPLTALEAAGVIRVTRVGASREGLVDPDDIRRALTSRTKLVAVIHASNVLGTIQPIAIIGHLAREHDALFLVDAAQTAGTYPIHVESSCIDLLAFPGHKGLLGPPGTGGLYVGPRAERVLRPWREGGTGVLSELPLQPDELPLRMEAGSPNVWGIAALGEAVRFLLDEGIERIRQREIVLLTQLLDAFDEDERIVLYGTQDLSQRVAVQSLNVRGVSPQCVGELLDQEAGIAVRAGLHCAPDAHRLLGTFPQGTIRISPGYFTTAQDIARCVQALQMCGDRWAPAAACYLAEEEIA